MEMTVNLLASNLETAIDRDLPKLETPLQRLVNNTMSGAEAIELLQRHWLLPQLQKELIISEAIAEIICSPEEIFSAYQAFYHQYQINTDRGRAEWLERNHCSLVQFEDLILRTIKLNRFKQIRFDRQVDSYFLQRKSQLDQVVYAILQVDNFYLAQELYLRIQDSEATFGELAPQYSGGRAIKSGGLIGPQELSIPHPILAQKLRSMRSGQLASPLQIGDCFVVIQFEQHLPAQLDPALRQRLTDELYEQWLQAQLHQLLVPTPTP